MKLKVLTYRLLGYKTIDELMEEMKEGKRNGIDKVTLDKSRKLMDAMIPNKTIFPKDAEVYESTKDVEISYLTSYMAPFTGGGKTILKKGERIIVKDPGSDRPTSVYCTAINYDKLEKEMVDRSERESPKYSGFYLAIETTELNNNFKRIEQMPINYLKGDATSPSADNTKIIIHICNDVGGWGKGFVLAISKKWKQPEIEYRNWFDKKGLEPNWIFRPNRPHFFALY